MRDDYFFQQNSFLKWFILLMLLLLNACAPQPPRTSPGHINTSQIPPPKNDIPPLIQEKPFVPPPSKSKVPLETFTVVVDNVPVDKLLFALARDADLNIDIHQDIKGTVTLNAINQTLPQLLARIAKQVDLRYQIEDNYLTISPDRPYVRLYTVDYVNLSRNSRSEVSVSTQIISDFNTVGGQTGGGEQGENNSTTQITNESNNQFWKTLETNIQAILASESNTDEKQAAQVIVNAESGVLTVRATHQQHQQIQRFLDKVIASIQKQVLIEATIAEVRLSDQYQAGIDWQRISGDFSYTQSMLGGNIRGAPFYSFGYNNSDSRFGNVSANVRLLEQFGNVKVLSSPKVMALNNQTAILKVVDNIVYFTTEVQINETETRSRETYTTEINTVPVGLVLSVTPQISQNDVVMLNIRPTISRVIDFKNDPNPALAAADTVNRIPEIQVREIESILKINNGDIAVIGGLMEDVIDQKKKGVPVLSHLPLVGDLFSYRDDNYSKTELVIFLRPVVVKQASLAGDLQDYQVYLPNPAQPDRLPPTGLNNF
jgi:MSHA type pilus biogenesis protein MshL